MLLDGLEAKSKDACLGEQSSSQSKARSWLDRESTVKFVTVRELRGHTSELWDELERQRELIVTSSGKPIAILSATDAESVERLLHNIRRCRATDALSSLQHDAAWRGLDQLTVAEVDDEIQAFRRDQQHERRRSALEEKGYGEGNV